MADLRKIGVEGFALIEKFYGPTSRRSSTAMMSDTKFAGRREMEEPLAAVTSKDAAAHFGGISVVSYSKGIKSHNRWVRPIKY